MEYLVCIAIGAVIGWCAKRYYDKHGLPFKG